MSKFLPFLALPITLYLISCDSKKQETNKTEIAKTVPEDFDSFYDKFHSDSFFQMSRIRFPLEGKYIDGFEKTDWKRENWTMLKTKISDVDTAQFKTAIIKTDSTFIEKYYIENSGFSSEYKFKLVNNEWFLVYAEDINI